MVSKILFIRNSNCFGIVIEVKLLQFLKAQSPIDVTESGIDIEVRLLQFSKAQSPIDVTESGIVIEVKLLQL